jgi:hypothetical protein
MERQLGLFLAMQPDIQDALTFCSATLWWIIQFQPPEQAFVTSVAFAEAVNTPDRWSRR